MLPVTHPAQSGDTDAVLPEYNIHVLAALEDFLDTERRQHQAVIQPGDPPHPLVQLQS